MYLFLETSNYILGVCAFIYALLSISVIFVKNGSYKTLISALLAVINMIIATVAFGHMYLVKGEIIFVYIFAVLFVAILMLLFMTKAIYRECDRLLLNNMSMLFTTGMIVITRISTQRAIRQLAIFLIVLLVCMLIPLIIIKAEFIKKITWVYAGVGISMISSVLILGEVINGSKITITLLGLRFQPSDAVKILFIFYMACLLWKDINHIKVILSAVTCAAFVLVLVMSKDLGAALIFVIIYIFMIYMSTGNSIYLILGGTCCTIASVVAYNLFSHIRVRVSIWLDPWADIDNKGYQIAQSLFSINGGGAFGTGLFKGSPTSIPFCETDFIFSAISEELGLIYGVSIILVCLSCFGEMMRLSFLVHDMFYRLVIYGIAVSMCFQTFLTIGGGVKFIPLTGVTLPMVSYGGTSLLVSMFMYFIVQGIYIRLRLQKGPALYRFHKKQEPEATKESGNNINNKANKEPLKNGNRKSEKEVSGKSKPGSSKTK